MEMFPGNGMYYSPAPQADVYGTNKQLNPDNQQETISNGNPYAGVAPHLPSPPTSHVAPTQLLPSGDPSQSHMMGMQNQFAQMHVNNPPWRPPMPPQPPSQGAMPSRPLNTYGPNAAAIPPSSSSQSFGPPPPPMNTQPMMPMMPPPAPMSNQPMVSGMAPPPPMNNQAMMSPMGQPSMPGMAPPPMMMPPRSMGGPQAPGFMPPMPPSMRPPGMVPSAPPPTYNPTPQATGTMPPHPQPFPPQNMPPASMQSPAAAPPQRRLDPDLMPSAVQVQEDDRVKKGGPFNPSDLEKAPPLVTTDFFCAEMSSNCSPSYIRSTLYNVPITADLMKQMNIQFSLACTPFASRHEREPSIQSSDMGPEGPVRCIRCKAYMSPHMTFIDGGRRFQCGLCGGTTEVPGDYFIHLDHTGRRMDCYQRPELCLGSYELVATREYCRNDVLPQPPAYIFALDVSYSSIKNGLVQLWCATLKQHILPYLPREECNQDGPSAIRVGFLTYDRVIHFYNLKSCLSQPQVQVLSDMTDVFVPLVDGFLVTVDEAIALIDILLEMIPRLYSDTRCTDTVLAPVIQVGMEALKAANCCGKVFVFHSSPLAPDASGKMKAQDDRKLIGTDKEKTLLLPSSSLYTELGQSCVKVGCSVDLFLFPNVFIDVPTIAEVARITGGNLYKYNYFMADTHGDMFLRDFQSAVSSPCAFDAVLRLRTSTGVRPVTFYGNFHMANTTDVDLCCLDRRTTVSCEIKHDDKLQDGDSILIQLACLYTSVSGVRRLRVHNLRLQATANKMDVFRTADLDTLLNLYAKESIHLLLHGGKISQDVRELLANKCARILAAYRTHCASNSNPGELILPEQMKLIPLYCNSLSNSDIISFGNEISTHDRSYLLYLVMGMPVKETNIYIYPRLVALHDVNPEDTNIPTAIRCSYERLNPQGVYILENGLVLFLWFGQQVSQEFMSTVFGVASAQQLDLDKVSISPQNNPLSARVFSIMDMIKAQRSRCMRTVVVRQNEKADMWFKHFLVEDRVENNASSYVDYLCHIHKEVRSIMNN